MTFSEQFYWDCRYRGGGNSGAGSYNQEANIKAAVINTWIETYDIKTISEFGCGDGNNLLKYKVPISYSGYDFSAKAVEICNQKTTKILNNLKYYFCNDVDGLDMDADVMLLLDVWYHQVSDRVFAEMLKTIFIDNNSRYMIVYTMDDSIKPDGMAEHMMPRPFLTELDRYPKWELVSIMSGFHTKDNVYVQMPENKKFYLLKNRLR